MASARTTETTPRLSLSPLAVNCASGNLGVPCITGSHQEPGTSSIEPLGCESYHIISGKRACNYHKHKFGINT